MRDKGRAENKKRILIVGDDPDICMTIREVLRDHGFAADSFTDLHLALNSFEAGSYDLLLLDIKMPEIGGFQWYQEIKRIDDRVKACFLTAVDVSYGTLSKENGFCEFDKETFSSKTHWKYEVNFWNKKIIIVLDGINPI